MAVDRELAFARSHDRVELALHGRGSAFRRPGGRARGRADRRGGQPGHARRARTARHGDQVPLPSSHNVAELPAELRDLVQPHDGELLLRTGDPTHVLAGLCSWAVGCGIELRGLEVVGPSLEDIYLQLTEAGGDGGA